MRAIVRRLHSPEIDDLQTYQPSPDVDFELLVQAMLGPEGERGEEAFNFSVVRDPNAVAPYWTGTRLFMRHFVYGIVLQEVERLCAKAEGSDWQRIAHRLGEHFHWEFAGYRASDDT